MPLNLDSIVSVAESFMVDEITITRVTDADRHWNPSTGTESTTPQTIYTGKAFVSPMGSPGEQTYAAEDIRRTYYEIGAPRSMPAIKPNDRLIVTKCRYDPLRYHEAKIQDLIEQLYDDVRRAASGRPGPDVRSGAYLGSIVKTETKVFTSSPYGPRLEYGFTGTDRLGRNYHQPPFPHWRPAAAMLRKQFPRQIKRSVIEVWRSS
jgi:hypothetical protein